ncbi:hypothetical protein [Streptomyces sp. H27-C3]|uniref:hypothetical protein n=1 Tax=Streptomyces sp. H27-C3 TaxID=3046305 RepID=UPI0024B99364|nr:hypothetical protein [Streptomyces sp. H27-C3]MDJ0466886.1 hypothetical protein [Streptomyces sp. H27-C3]
MARKYGFGARAAAAPAAMLIGALLLTACGGDAEDKAGGEQGGGKSKELKWAECMRAKGLDVPDPKPGQMPMMSQGQDEAKADAARQKCKKYNPMQVSDSEKKKFASELRVFAKCMRKNGVPEQADPDENGTLLPPSEEVAQTQRYQDAETKCQDKLKSFKRQNQGG